MKKCITVFACALALASSAATWERVGSLQIAGTDGLVAAVAKIGEISGNQMLGVMAASQIPQLPGSDFFGPMRQGASMAFALYFDSEELAKAAAADGKDLDDIDDVLEYAVVYPMALPKEEFLKMHEGAVETNGMVCVKGSPFEAGSDDLTYVAFSQSGKWAVASDRREQVSLALADVSTLVKPMKGDVARVDILPRATELLSPILDAAVKKIAEEKGECPLSAEDIDLAKGLSSMKGAIRVGDAGVDIYGEYKALPGSALARLGTAPFGDSPFANAAADELVSSENAFQKIDAEAGWKAVAEVLAKYKIDTSSFMKLTFGKATRLELDPSALVSWKKAAATNELADVDFDDLNKDIAAALSCQKNGRVPATEKQVGGFAIAGFKPQFTPAQRFAATLPETAGEKFAAASVMSLSGIVQAVAPAVIASLDDATRASIAPAVALLPRETKGGIASAYMRVDEVTVKGICRISADEIKSIGVSVGAIAAMAMMNSNVTAGCPVDDEDEDGDGENDD